MRRASTFLVACAGVTAAGLSACGGGDTSSASGRSPAANARGDAGNSPTTASPSSGDAETAGGGGSDGSTGSDSRDGGPSDATGGTDDGCTSGADCADNPAASVCDYATAMCVECTADNAPCTAGSYCDTADNSCKPGCLDDSDCPKPLACDTPNKVCTGCMIDGDCGLGSICDSGKCIPGCTAKQPCVGTDTCCSGQCVDLETDEAHCGACGDACTRAHASAACTGGTCAFTVCDAGYADCDTLDSTGCEILGTCACNPGDPQSCYPASPGTEGIGICIAGTQACNARGTGWGACQGFVTPGTEGCTPDGLDNDCDTNTDEDLDSDGDGWTQCGGDCCDEAGPNCGTPALVNPGAFEVAGSLVDDDCDGVVDNPTPACDAGLSSNSATPLDYAKAIDLCQTTVESPTDPTDRTWGVIQGWFYQADGANSPNATQRSIRPGFGTVIAPQFGQNLAVLSTGAAADAADVNPGYVNFQNPGVDHGGGLVAVPGDWLSANGGDVPNDPSCPISATSGEDSIMFKLRVRVPTNANSFSVMMYFLSSEYPEWVCSPYNDFFIALIDSLVATNPADRNLAVSGGRPVGVNIVKSNPALFTQCQNGDISCAYPPTASYAGCTASTELVGTGMDLLNPAPKFGGNPGYCGTNNQLGGGTGWLKMSGNVSPGETIEMRFVTWDTGDGWYDSVILLDDWEWSVQASQPGVTPQ